MKYVYALLALGCTMGAFYIATIEEDHMYITACSGIVVEYKAPKPLSTEANETLCRAVEQKTGKYNVKVIRITDVFTNEMTLRFGGDTDETEEDL